MIYLLPHTVDESADRDAQQVAFRCGPSSITYGELVVRSNQLAHLLRDRNVRPGDRVGILMTRSVDTAVAVYGIMKAGAAFVPIDMHVPPSAFRRLVDHCGIHVLVTHGLQETSLQHFLADVVTVSTVVGVRLGWDGAPQSFAWDALTDYPSVAPQIVQLTEQDLAYIMYSSGSTGRPKGIMHTHHSGLSYACLSVDTYGVTCSDVIGNHSPLHFDMSTFGYFSGPLAGATTVIVPEAYARLPASLSQLMQDERVTIWYSVPLALIQLLHYGALEQRDVQSLRWVLFGGEPFHPKHVRELMRLWPQATFSNVYGPAEVNQCTYYHIPDSFLSGNCPQADAPIPIGKPWANTEVLIVDEQDRQVAQGKTGELAVRSPTMMLGYWNCLELNAHAFLRQQVFPQIEKTFYRTGDLVQLDADQNLVFLGRRDRQVKIRGHRVELDDIELALTGHNAVAEAAVFAVRHPLEDSAHIRAAVMLNGGEVSENALRSFAALSLPRYAVPESISVVLNLPRTTSGKIDRRRLQREAEEACQALLVP